MQSYLGPKKLNIHQIVSNEIINTHDTIVSSMSPMPNSASFSKSLEVVMLNSLIHQLHYLTLCSTFNTNFQTIIIYIVFIGNCRKVNAFYTNLRPSYKNMKKIRIIVWYWTFISYSIHSFQKLVYIAKRMHYFI